MAAVFNPGRVNQRAATSAEPALIADLPPPPKPCRSFWTVGLDGADHVNGNGAPSDLGRSIVDLEHVDVGCFRLKRSPVSTRRASATWSPMRFGTPPDLLGICLHPIIARPDSSVVSHWHASGSWGMGSRTHGRLKFDYAKTIRRWQRRLPNQPA